MNIQKYGMWNRQSGQKSCRKKGYPGVSAIDFYDDIFGEDLEEERLPEDYVRGEYAAIAIERVKKLDKDGQPVLDSKGKEKYVGRRYTVTRGNQELYDLIDRSEKFLHDRSDQLCREDTKE